MTLYGSRPSLNHIHYTILRQVRDGDLPVVMNLREQSEIAVLAAMRLVSHSGGIWEITGPGLEELFRETGVCDVPD